MTEVRRVSDLGGRSIRWLEYPGAAPAVVYINGCGLSAIHWRPVARQLPEVHQLGFDRPGLGGTRWPGRLPILAEEVRTLRELILARDAAPAVLVAHSMASFHAEAMARIHPELVAGIVMVDGSVEMLAKKPRRGTPVPAQALRAAMRLQPFGRFAATVHRFGASLQSLQHNFGHDWDNRLTPIYQEPDALAMGAAEARAYWRQAWDLQQLRRERALPAVPIIVLTAGNAPFPKRWRSRQRAWAQAMGGRSVLVDGSRHLMMIDRPDAIVDAIRSVRQGVREPAG